MDHADFESLAIEIKERRTELFRDEATLCASAVLYAAARTLGNLWGWSAQRVNTMAQIFETWGVDGITPDTPLTLYRAALGTDDPRKWLEDALKGGWSARQLRDKAGSAKGERVSSVPLVPAGSVAQVVTWEPGIIEIVIPNWEPSGEPPAVVRLGAIREVLGE